MNLSGRDYRTGKGISVSIRNGVIASIKPFDAAQGKPGKGKSWIAPGLVELQINGYRGRDFNTVPVPDDLAGKVTRDLWGEGITSYFATVITNSPDAIEACVGAIARACASDPDVAAGIPGIHLEGPFISPDDGPRGAHDRVFVRAPDMDLFRRWQDAARGRIRIITVSPEWPQAIRFIEQVSDTGVTVSIGHTAATPEQIREAVAAGASMSTHLGNGSHLMLPRHPNYLWEQLAQDDLAACIIPDGFHLPDAVLKVVLRVKGPHAMLTSDAVYLSGMPAGTYETHIGGKVVLTPEGRLHLADNPKILAGSAQMLGPGVDHLVNAGLADLGEAWEMASIRPASRMNLAAGKGLTAGAPADLVVFDRDEGRIEIRQTWKDGKKVFERK